MSNFSASPGGLKNLEKPPKRTAPQQPALIIGEFFPRFHVEYFPTSLTASGPETRPL